MSQPLFRESPRGKCFRVLLSARTFLLLAWCGLMVLPAPAAVRYVNLNNPTPAPPFTNWATAARTIQDAVDVTVDGDEVLVTNGVYRTGGRVAVPPVTNTPITTVSNRVTVTNQITLRSVNGPGETMIEGKRGIGIGSIGQARCVSLSSNSLLSGFTLTNGSAGYIIFIFTNGANVPYADEFGGGAYAMSGSMISNCVVVSNSSSGVHGGALFDCIVMSNTASFSGGGAYGATLSHCVLRGNFTLGNFARGVNRGGGGGAYRSVLSHSLILGNSCGPSPQDYDSEDANGGGVLESDLVNCVLSMNSTKNRGGGAAYSSLVNCMLDGNTAEHEGGGAFASKLDKSMIMENAAFSGGGVGYSELTRCTLIGNTASSGGGARSSAITNSVLTQNFASFIGGGSYGGSLINTLLLNNQAIYEGGGALASWLTQCTLAGNLAEFGGGTKDSYLTNCIVFHNTATNGTNHLDSSFHFSCTTPLPMNGTGNITNDPAFIDLPGGNLRLASNSPCRNAGDNAFALGATDLDGRARIIGGTVDMGAYEFQPGVSGVFLGWLQQFGLHTDGTDDTLDTDGDLANNFQEWRAGTIPTNALSALRLLTPSASDPDLVVRWASVPGKSYFLTRSTNLTTGASFVPFAQNLPGQPGTTMYTDTNAASSGGRNYFYQVGVEP